MRIVSTFAEPTPGIADPEESMSARVLSVTGRRHWSRAPRAGRRYSWVEDHLSRLEGKEARDAYYVRLEG